MPPRRPTAVVVLAICHLAVASYGFLCSSVGTWTLAWPERPKSLLTSPQYVEALAYERRLRADIPSYRDYQIAQVAIGWAFTGMLIISAWGLLRMRTWARSLSIFYALLSILHKLLAGLYGLFVLLVPYELVVLQNAAKLDPLVGDVAAVTAVIGGVLTPLLMMIYPIAVLVVLSSVKGAFANPIDVGPPTSEQIVPAPGPLPGLP